MKKIFTLITASVLMISAFAQPNADFKKGFGQGTLSISSSVNQPVKIFVDGTNYTGKGNGEILVKDLRAGYHAVKVYQEKKVKNTKVSKFGNKQQLIYEGNVYIKAQYHVDITINRFGKAFVDERSISQGYYDEDDTDHGGWDNAVQPMSARSFDQFKQVIRKESFDNTKLVVAKQTISTNNLSAAQVKEIVQLFSFENSKLDIAKYSYKYTVDQNNYFMLNDAFAFSSSKEELARFIQAYR